MGGRLRAGLLAFALGAMALSGCEKATAENFAKIEVGMKRDDVYRILGKPDSIDGSVGTDRADDLATEIWENGPQTITIFFAGEFVETRSIKSNEQR